MKLHKVGHKNDDTEKKSESKKTNKSAEDTKKKNVPKKVEDEGEFIFSLLIHMLNLQHTLISYRESLH